MNQLLAKYHPLDHHYDELARDGRKVRHHWTHFLDSLEALGTNELRQRLFEAHRQILDNGVSYSISDKGVVNWRLHTLYVVGPPNPNTVSTLQIEQGGAS